jgi:hypothetical protein
MLHYIVHLFMFYLHDGWQDDWTIQENLDIDSKNIRTWRPSFIVWLSNPVSTLVSTPVLTPFFPVSTLGVLTPVLVSQHLILNAKKCLNVKPAPLYLRITPRCTTRRHCRRTLSDGSRSSPELRMCARALRAPRIWADSGQDSGRV